MRNDAADTLETARQGLVMARLTQAQTRARERLDAIQSGSPERVVTRIADALHGAVGWDGFRLLGIDPATGLINRVLAASDGDAPAREEWLRDVYLKAERAGLGFVELSWLARSNLRAVAFQDRLERCHGYPADVLRLRSEREFQRAFFENHAPVGGTILANFHAGDRWVASLQAYRRDSGAPFRTGDVAFVRLVAPRVAMLFQSALARDAAWAARAAPVAESSGIILVERTGRIRYATPAGETWFDALRAVPGEATTSLPTALWGAIAGLGADGQRAVMSVRLPLGAVTIEATPGGSDGSVALVIASVRTIGPVVPPAAWGLTSAEERITALVIQGRGNRAISDHLSISEHTVEWHLRRIFDKLDLRSRGQLTARFFRDTGLPAVVGDGAA